MNNNSKGLARIHAILLALCAALLALISIPACRAYRYHGQWLACAESLRVVNGALVVSLLDEGEAFALDEASEDLVSILPGRDGYCPAGGTVYFRKGESGEWKAVCGMHDSDHLERTRLNASYVLRQLREQLRKARLGGDRYPEELTVWLNGRELACRLVEEETGIRRGTDTTRGYKGTVCFFGLAGHGCFPVGAAGASGGQMEEGDLSYFCFANEEYNANWRIGEGWSGTSYGDRY